MHMQSLTGVIATCKHNVWTSIENRQSNPSLFFSCPSNIHHGAVIYVLDCGLKTEDQSSFLWWDFFRVTGENQF